MRKKKVENITETNFLKLCNKFLPKNIQFFIKEQIKLQNSKNGIRYTQEFKRYALSFFFFCQMPIDFCKKLLVCHLLDVYKNLLKTGQKNLE